MDDALKDSVLEWDKVTHDYDEQVDAVVVGTGCGGAVVAKELARAGKSVLMLERGGFFLMDKGDFDQREDDMFARIDGGRGLDTSDDTQIALTYGRNVGGASVHYWADTWRTPKDRCDKWAYRYGVTGHTYEELLPHFERIEKDLNVHPAEDERLNAMNRLFEKGSLKLGFEVERVLQARKNCTGSGYCMQGCAYDAKMSQLVTHLPEALAAGARIFADCEVEAVTMEGGRATGVRARFLDRRAGKPSGKKLRVRAKIVVVAAGGYNTAPILMRSKIPDPSGQLGRNLQVNPVAQTYALFDEDVVLWRNIPAGVGIMGERLARRDAHGHYQGGGYLMHPNQLPPATLAALLPGFGKAHRELMDQAHRIGSCIAWCDDVGSGHVELDDEGYPIWHFPIEGEDALMLRDAMKLQARIMLAAGAREVIIPDPVGTRVRDEKEVAKIDSVDIGPGSMMFPSPHPAGMCRMGPDPAKSVVDCNHEVHAVKGLFVCDPSAFPTVVSVDPSETIMAWSYVAVAGILRDWHRFEGGQGAR
jgi:choline dehydrogenase-like flavoprotein